VGYWACRLGRAGRCRSRSWAWGQQQQRPPFPHGGRGAACRASLAGQSRRERAAEQGDEADEAFGGMVAGMDMPPHARAARSDAARLRSLSPVFCGPSGARRWRGAAQPLECRLSHAAVPRRRRGAQRAAARGRAERSASRHSRSSHAEDRLEARLRHFDAAMAMLASGVSRRVQKEGHASRHAATCASRCTRAWPETCFLRSRRSRSGWNWRCERQNQRHTGTGSRTRGRRTTRCS
jgi:hypothetical protein